MLAKGDKSFEAELSKIKGKAVDKNIPNADEAQKIVDFLKNYPEDFDVTKVTKKSTKRKPTAPFITSTLQRAASSKLGFGVQKTMHKNSMKVWKLTVTLSV